ncbi:hypothetical protein BH09PSE5_BH09PSE5_06820 [soil metagenome]
MSLSGSDLADTIPDLGGKTHTDRILAIGWYLHTRLSKAQFEPSDVKRCYDEAHLGLPTSFSGYFQSLTKQKRLLRSAGGYRLESGSRQVLHNKYGQSEVSVRVSQLLISLPGLINNIEERTYLNEALICYKHGAFRAAVVMAWNLAYDHLCRYILANRLNEFNAAWFSRYPGHHKKAVVIIKLIEDFGVELKESEVIEIAKSAKIITPDATRILTEKLGKRNSAAHPSEIVIEQVQADAFIDDLVRNVVLRLV